MKRAKEVTGATQHCPDIMSKTIFSIIPVRFYPFPMTIKDELGVSRSISINALKYEGEIVAVPQRILSAHEVRNENDLLKVGVHITEWSKMKEDNGAWWVKATFGNPVKFERIWFDKDLNCFMGEGEFIQIKSFPISEDDDVKIIAIAEACKHILKYFAHNNFFEFAPTLSALIGKIYNWVRNLPPIAIASDPALQERIIQFMFTILDNQEISYYILPQDYENILSQTNFEDFIMQMLEFVKSLDMRIEELKKIHKKADENIAKQNRIFYLTSVREAVNSELREITNTTGDPEIDEMLEEIDENPLLPEKLKIKLREELESVAGPAINPERPIIIRHVQFVLSLPWGKYIEPNTNFSEVKRILEESHYGLYDVKERILEYLSLYVHLKRPPKGNILCFIGPPGTGKTSMAQAIAEALKLPFYRISLGGVSDEAEIKGHRRTYIGAMPGRIAYALSQVKALNGIIFLDEIDKLGISYKGRPDAALLDALDPDRNWEFFDHYVDYPIDISNILFICGANVMENIDPILADRMEFIRFTGYIYPEKFQIAKYYIIPKIRQEWNIGEETVAITDKAISYIIENWGRWESGVREIKRKLESAFRKALGLNEGKITPKFLREHFPPVILPAEWKNEYIHKVGYIPVIGVNQSGEGTVFWVEIHKTPISGDNKGWNIEIVGSADESMKESAKSAFLWCCQHIPSFADSNYRWIIYLPSVSIPRGGPSASLAFAIGLIYTHLNRPLGKLIAMTGEISASGKILPVGGTLAKIIAAENAGFEEIIIPAANKPEVDFWVKQRRIKLKIRIIPVESIEEVLRHLGLDVVINNPSAQANTMSMSQMSMSQEIG